MPFASHECRWFFRGRLGDPRDEITERFRSAGGWRRSAKMPGLEWPDAWRDDRYVFVGSTGSSRPADFAVKLRDERSSEGPLRLEFKACTASLGPVRFAPDATGMVDQWLKWSFTERQVPETFLEPWSSSSNGILVRKKRLLRKVRFDAAGDDEEVPAGATIDRGMEIELTRVLAHDQEHWTLGFEATPQDAHIHDDFLRATQRFLKDFHGTAELSEANSMSYPEWLRRLSGVGDV